MGNDLTAALKSQVLPARVEATTSGLEGAETSKVRT